MIHFLNWSILLVILAFIGSGKVRIEIIAVSGLLIMAIIGSIPTNIVFSGFGHPALITIISVFVLSRGIVSSGILRGLGQEIALKFKGVKSQIISLSVVSSILSAFMNNVGAVGLLLPTSVRMADRQKINRGAFGLPLALVSIIGGSLTLIGSAPNIITAAYMYSLTGESFKMFDFAYHGLAMIISGIIIWFVINMIIDFEKFCGPSSNPVNLENDSSLNKIIRFSPFENRKKTLTVLIVSISILLVSIGILHPAIGFGCAGVLLIVSKVLSPKEAYSNIDINIVIFLGSMLGISKILEYSSSMDMLSNFLTNNIPDFQPFPLILIIIFISTALSNGINNSAAAVFMSPIAASLANNSNLDISAALMAVAAGSNMTFLLPTHQAVLMVKSKAPFLNKNFIKIGIILTIALSFIAGFVISLVWQV